MAHNKKINKNKCEDKVIGYSVDNSEGIRLLITTDLSKAVAFAKENNCYVFEGELCRDKSNFKENSYNEIIYRPIK